MKKKPLSASDLKPGDKVILNCYRTSYKVIVISVNETGIYGNYQMVGDKRWMADGLFTGFSNLKRARFAKPKFIND